MLIIILSSYWRSLDQSCVIYCMSVILLVYIYIFIHDVYSPAGTGEARELVSFEWIG